MRPLVSETLRKLPKYVPGKSIEAVKRELGLSQIIKLASNESPFGPSPKAVEAMKAAAGEVHRYPDEGADLRAELAQRCRVGVEQTLLGAGATDLIELAVRAFCTSDGHAVFSNGSFIAYRLFAQAVGVPSTAVPLKGWELDLEAMAAATTSNTQVLFLANPNNPTASRFGAEAFERFLGQIPDDVVLVLDDAYRDYNDQALDTVGVIKRRPRTLVLQSFSKVHGLAGMRCGYAISSEEVIAAMNQIHRPFPVARLAMEGARAALDDTEHVQRTVEGTRVGRTRLMADLAELGFSVLPSFTNFVTVELADEAASTRLTRRLLERGFIIRALAAFGMPNFARFSVGSPEELRLLVSTVNQLVQEEPSLTRHPLR